MADSAADTQLRERFRVPRKRKLEHWKRGNPKEAKTNFTSHGRGKKLREKRNATGRDSDAEEEENDKRGAASSSEEGDESDAHGGIREGQEEGNDSGGSDEDGGEEGMQQGVTKFTNGCRAFKMAFTKITKKSGQTDPLFGPILSAHKKLVVKKLAEEGEEQKAKGEAKKKRHLAAQRGHVKPASFLDSKEKFLISVATKGVVKLFNAVNKAQHPQQGLDPSRSKDAKELAKRTKEAFFSEIRKPTTRVATSTGNNNDEPGWAPLRDSYLLTSSRLKDWDKMENPSTSAGPDVVHSESSSDED